MSKSSIFGIVKTHAQAEQIVLLLATASFLCWLQVLGGYRSLRRGALLGETGLVIKAAGGVEAAGARGGRISWAWGAATARRWGW